MALYIIQHDKGFLIVFGFNDTSILVDHFLSSHRDKEIKEIIVEVKKRDREERGTGMKVKKHVKG